METRKPTGAIEYIRSPQEQAEYEALRAVQARIRAKKPMRGADLTPVDVADLVLAIAKKLKIL